MSSFSKYLERQRRRLEEPGFWNRHLILAGVCILAMTLAATVVGVILNPGKRRNDSLHRTPPAPL